MGNNVDGNVAMPQQWTPQQQGQNMYAAGVWGGWSPQERNQFMSGMSDWYQTGGGQGQFQQDQQNAWNYWQPFSQGMAQWYQQRPGLLKEHHEQNYVEPNPQPQMGGSAPQTVESMSDWQKWQLENRPMGATSTLVRPEDVALDKEISYDPYENMPVQAPTAPRNPLGPLYHPRDGVAGGDFGGFVKAPGRDTAISHRPPSFNPAPTAPQTSTPEPVPQPQEPVAPYEDYQQVGDEFGFDMDQFMAGMGDWYRSQPGRLAEDRAAVEAAGGPGSPQDVYDILEQYYKNQNKNLSNNLTAGNIIL